VVLTGGSSALPGSRDVANSVLGVPVRVSKPENLFGMKDRLDSPAYSTSVGLLHWAMMMREITPEGVQHPNSISEGGGLDKETIMDWLRRLIP